MTDAVVERAAEFLWRNGRLIDRRRFEHRFAGGSADAVVAALRAYRNDDGGFANALEPDLRTPVSQPQPAEVALHVLAEVGALDDPMVLELCDWLATIAVDGAGVPFTLPSAKDHPCAPWWITDDEHPPPSLNPTAAICGLLHSSGVSHPWLDRATEWCWSTVEAAVEPAPYDLLAIVRFLDGVPDRARAEAAFEERVAPVVRAVTEDDPDAGGHVFKPVDLAPTPHTLARRVYGDDEIDRHLDGLLRRQQEDGGWPITWDPPSPAAVLEWRGFVTVQALRTLHEYGRL